MNSVLLGVLQACLAMFCFVLFILIVLVVSLAFGPAQPPISSATCNILGGTTFCHF